MTRSRKRKLARNRAKWASMPLASALMAGGGAAHAVDAANAASASDTVVLDEVVVTAQKRSEDLQKVPISLQVLSGKDLEQHNVTDFDDFAKLLPSVSYQSLGPGQAQVYFRGIASGADGLHAGSLPATGVYLDEIPVTTIGNTLDVHIYDMARVEALAGPQGTLYGASSLSGTIRLITNKPDPTKFSAGYDVKADDYGPGSPGGEFEGYINVPITDKLAVRLVGFYDYEGGYINNVPTTDTFLLGSPYGDPPTADHPQSYSNTNVVEKTFNPVTTYGGRGALKYDVNDNWSIMPQVLWQSQRADGNFSYDPAKGDLNVGDFGPEYNEDKWYQSALTIQGKISNFDVVYSGGWFERNVHNVVDYTGYSVAYDHVAHTQPPPGYYYNNYVRYLDCVAGTPANNCNGAGGTFADPTQFVNNHDKYTKQSQELRFSSPADYRFRGTAGLFYQRQTDNIRAAFQTNDLPTYYTVDGSPNTVYLSQQDRTDRDYAIFGDGTFDITSQWKVSAGIRQFWVNNTLYGFFGFNGGQSGEGSCVPPPSPATIIPGYWPCVNTNKKVVEDGETHRVNLTYQIDPDHMVYATYSTGFRPGGNNRRTVVAPYRDDTLSNYEIGWKTSWLGGSLRTNGAVFYEKWDDVQLSVTGANGITSIVNVGNADVKGVESQIDWLPIDDLTISASATYVDAKTTQNFCNVDQTTEAVTHNCTDPQAPSGTQLPVTPKIKSNATARYKFATGDYQNFAQLAFFHQGSSTSQLKTADNDAMGNLPQFSTFDISAGTGLNNWKLEAFINNVFDKRGQLGRIAQCANEYCFQNYRVYPVKPQLFGIRFGQKF
jgi:iron complex outermembrane recepter protein